MVVAAAVRSDDRPMDSRIQALVDEQHGAFSAAEASARGIDATALRSAARAGQVVRVRRAAYVDRVAMLAAGPDERFRLAAMAVARTRPGDALSHHAALALHGLPLWGHDPARIDLLGDARQIVHRSGVSVRPLEGAHTEQVRGLAVVGVARAVVGTALTMGPDCAVVAGDAALHRGLVGLDDLLHEVAGVSPHEGRQPALDAVLRMDAKAESVGESRTRLILQDAGLPHESQYVITDEFGFVARVDFLVDGVVLEFDGKLKYQRSRDREDGPEADPGEVVWLEKRREDRVRRLGYPFERVVWDELSRPQVLGRRLRDARRNRRSA
ncbi:hypothetical protein GCM10009721_17410 [Terrabacter tumescens]|uniref:AbiEi antitoxin N-terminal domain-containing protein n=2 Tax=Terrabacter tumescens TaxID=60443 RepID=A0ABQ2HWY2_9MICO|nr:hypothetical protein GCM10009721_17410 [Terrabacter tumescens]